MADGDVVARSDAFGLERVGEAARPFVELVERQPHRAGHDRQSIADRVDHAFEEVPQVPRQHRSDATGGLIWGRNRSSPDLFSTLDGDPQQPLMVGRQCGEPPARRARWNHEH